ncbi:hypothetical protein IVIADoCa9_7 [Xanthomonas phage vB_Xar_IVIA-DoCa9]|uniref:Uncharacterized protein n=1 Tax=Xanthomonas phage vB_Xar_IVIA-DoCa9 TaxID=2975536 RepID=A0A9X9JND9_9CAUD|nr:hypothetical protein IVIADoCa9_7 [Xanthomonas phage vB_Xar_IVIA-DoCa9]
MSRLTGIYGERAVALLLAADIAARADIDDENSLGEALCEKIADQLQDTRYRDDYTQDEVGAAVDLRTQLYREWPEWSGCSTYPVPASGEDDDMIDEYRSDNEMDTVDWDDPDAAAAAYFDAVDECALYNGNMYDEGSEYGRSRRRLLTFLIDELTKESVNA